MDAWSGTDILREAVPVIERCSQMWLDIPPTLSSLVFCHLDVEG